MGGRTISKQGFCGPAAGAARRGGGPVSGSVGAEHIRGGQAQGQRGRKLGLASGAEQARLGRGPSETDKFLVDLGVVSEAEAQDGGAAGGNRGHELVEGMEERQAGAVDLDRAFGGRSRSFGRRR